LHYPEISVILPFYNAHKTLKRALRSLAGQTFPYFECLMVDNGSTDSSVAIANEFVTSDDRFKLLHEQERGVVPAFLKGIEYARGKFIARMDADDVSMPERFDLQNRFLQKHPQIDLIAGKVILKSDINNFNTFSRYVEWSNAVLSENDINLKQFVELPVINPTLMWRREINDKYELYRVGPFPEDYEMVLRWLSKGVRMAKIDANVLYWYDSDSRLTRTDPRYTEEAFFRIKSFYLAKWLRGRQIPNNKIMVWGASKKSRKLTQFLYLYGYKPIAYIDIKRTRKLSIPVLYYMEIPSPGGYFVLVYVFHPEQREKTRCFLIERGYIEGENFLLL